MREAPRKRPAVHEVVATMSSHVRARPQRVFDAIVSRLHPGPDAGSAFTADPRALLVISQGGWWYRGEYRVVPDDHGCHVEHAVVNVAQRAPRIASFTGRTVIRDAPAEFERLMRQLRLELE